MLHMVGSPSPSSRQKVTMYFREVILLYLSFCWCSAQSPFNLREGSACVAHGVNGTCVNMYKCFSAASAYFYRSAGYDIGKIPRDIVLCFYDDNNGEPVVCCTDCDRDEKETFRYFDIGPAGLLKENKGSVAWQKCLEYFNKLSYSCQGIGDIGIPSTWNPIKKCYEPQVRIALIAGGRPAKRWEFPHLALLIYGPEVNNVRWMCGGSVISDRFILTAAHCSSTSEGEPVSYAALGVLRRSDPKDMRNIYKIQKIIVHPDYKPPSKYNDIALLKTATKIKFGKAILPACLDTGKPNDYSEAEAAGWGQLGPGRENADILQVVTLKEFNVFECIGFNWRHRFLRRGFDNAMQMCYGSHTEIVDTCPGDSGGPLQIHDQRCMYTVIGVTSYGKYCGRRGVPGVYTRVQYYVPWIENIVWPNN